MINMFWVHEVTVETFQGTGAYGDTFAAPVTVKGFLNDAAHYVKTASNQTVESQTTFYTDPSNAVLFAANSKVNAGLQTSRVITVNANDSAGLGLPDHVEVHLT